MLLTAPEQNGIGKHTAQHWSAASVTTFSMVNLKIDGNKQSDLPDNSRSPSLPLVFVHEWRVSVFSFGNMDAVCNQPDSFSPGPSARAPLCGQKT